MAFSIEHIRQFLQEPGDGVLRQRGFLQASLGDPDGFARALLHDAAMTAEQPCKSQYRLAYDLYHDAVLRHASGPAAERPCFLIASEAGSGNPTSAAGTLTYARLHALASRLARSWVLRGAVCGERICILYPLGPELLVALCAAWKLGLIPCLLPPLGAEYLGRRLRVLRPHHLVTARRYHILLREWYASDSLPLAEAVLPEPSLHRDALPDELDADATSFSYAPRDAALVQFSPQRDPCTQPSPIAAQALYLGGLCDGLLLGLRPGDVLAAPEHHFTQYLPTLLLTLLLHRGTYLHLNAAALLGSAQTTTPRPRARPAIDVLLLNTTLRDKLLALPARALSEVRSCVVPLTEQENSVLWRDLITHGELQRIPFLTWHYDAAAGGCVLFSLRQRGTVPQLVYPSPGRPFLLADPQADDAPARGNHGILRSYSGACGLLLYEHNGGYVYGGTQHPSRAGISLARDEVEAAVSALPFVAGAVVIPTPSDRGQSTLLCFIGPHLRHQEAMLQARLSHQVAVHIRNRLGSSFVPSSIQILASLPRRNERGIDAAWCARNLHQLSRRAADPVLHLLDTLHFASHRAATPLGHLALQAQRGHK